MYDGTHTSVVGMISDETKRSLLVGRARFSKAGAKVREKRDGKQVALA
jgi:hypothetical protein